MVHATASALEKKAVLRAIDASDSDMTARLTFFRDLFNIFLLEGNSSHILRLVNKSGQVQI